jgi:hypothetical protein
MILLALVLVILLPSTLNAFNNLYQNAFFKANWESLTASEKGMIETQYDNLVKNLNTCRNIAKKDCLCSNIISNFPDGTSIKITHGNDESVSLFYGKREIKNSTMQTTFISGMSFLSKENIVESKQNYVDSITFKEGIQYLNGKKIISSGVYKIYPSRLGIVTTDKNSETKQLPIISALLVC